MSGLTFAPYHRRRVLFKVSSMNSPEIGLVLYQSPGFHVHLRASHRPPFPVTVLDQALRCARNSAQRAAWIRGPFRPLGPEP
jgi:hypothetical protein